MYIVLKLYICTSLKYFRFNSLENEVRKRDEIISQLQKRIQELERLGLVGQSPGTPQSIEPEDSPQAGERLGPGELMKKNGSSGSEDISGADEGFMVCNLYFWPCNISSITF